MSKKRFWKGDNMKNFKAVVSFRKGTTNIPRSRSSEK